LVGRYVNGAPVNYCQLLRECQSYPVVCWTTGTVAVPLGKFSFKDGLELAGRDVEGPICNGNGKVSRRHTRPYFDGAGRRTEFYSVGYQVDQNSLDLGGVECHHERLDGNGKIDLKLFLSGQRMEACRRGSNERRDVGPCEFKI